MINIKVVVTKKKDVFSTKKNDLRAKQSRLLIQFIFTSISKTIIEFNYIIYYFILNIKILIGY